MKFSKGFVALLSLGCVLTLIGCGAEDGIGKRYKVTGKVTYKGEPLKSGSVNFYPDDVAKGQPAAGSIKEDGTYTLGTRGGDDGALAGKYKVSITSYNVDASKTGAPAQGGSQDQVVVGKAMGKSLIPIKYTGTDASGLSADITSSSTKFDFDLKD